MADAVVELTDADLKTHEDIGRARLRMQSRQWHSGKFNAQFTDKAGQTNIALGVQISVAEPERLKLIQARRALALGQGDNIRQLKYNIKSVEPEQLTTQESAECSLERIGPTSALLIIYVKKGMLRNAYAGSGRPPSAPGARRGAEATSLSLKPTHAREKRHKKDCFIPDTAPKPSHPPPDGSAMRLACLSQNWCGNGCA